MFNAYQGRPVTRMAFEILPAPAMIVVPVAQVGDATLYECNGVRFRAYQNPLAGDYVVRLTEDDTYHCTKAVFEERNFVPPAVSAPAQPPVTTISADDAFEAEIKAKGLTAPRITPDHLRSIIMAEHTFTVGAALRALCHPTDQAFDLVTICALKLKNGFTVLGESAVASPENFNAELGAKVARDKAISALWPLEGYLLKEKLHIASAEAMKVLEGGQP